MAKKTAPKDPNPPTPKKYKAQDPEARQRQLINAAMDAAEDLILSGKAPAGVLVHFLKLASKRDELERQILKEQAELLKSKTGAIESNKDQERLTREAMDAMTRYKGND